MNTQPQSLASEEPNFGALVVLDWADQKHVWSLQTADSDQREHGEIQHTPEAIEAWVGGLFSRFPAQPIALAVEQSRGALVLMLGKYKHLNICPIHPRAAAQFRAALYPSGAKDDPVDASLLLDLLVHHRGHLRRLSPDTEQTRLVQQLVEARRTLVNEKTRQSNRLTAKFVSSSLKGDHPRWPEWEPATLRRRPPCSAFYTRFSIYPHPRDAVQNFIPVRFL